jgi:hypothetical protein
MCEQYPQLFGKAVSKMREQREMVDVEFIL